MRAALALAALLVAAPGFAQPADGSAGRADAPRRAPLRMDDLEPAVDVGRMPGASSAAQPASARRPDERPAPLAAPPPAAPQAPPAPAAAAARGTVMDALDLGTTSITGNQELPKVLYIVPWKKSDLGELVGRPANTLLDEVLAPIDPEEFERHLSYYEGLHGSSQTEE